MKNIKLNIDGKDIKITSPTKYRTTFDSKIKFDAQIFADLVNGYEHYSKPLSKNLKDRYSEKDDTVMANYKDCDVIRAVHDTPCYFVIDKKNRNLIVIYHFAEQFICPIENISSVQVSDSGVRNNISRTPVSGGAISTSGRIGIMGGSAPLSTVGNPLIWTITISYFTKNGDVASYSLPFNSRRSYVLTKEWNLAGTAFEMYTDSISQETQKRLLDVKQTIEAYMKQEVDTSSLEDNDITEKMTKATLENKLISNVVNISSSKEASNDRKYVIKSVLTSVGIGILVMGGIIGAAILIMYACGVTF